MVLGIGWAWVAKKFNDLFFHEPVNYNSFQFFEQKLVSREYIMAKTISRELLDILACPKCKGQVHLDEEGQGLICQHCKLVYEIRQGIPIMLVDEAKALGELVANEDGK